MWKTYIVPSNLDELVDILDTNGENIRIVAGATDLLLELEKSLHKQLDALVDITRVPGLDSIRLDEDGIIHIGPLVTHNEVASSPILREFAFPLVSASWQVGAPQIRNRGTIAGNLITASPANDTIPPLIALEAELTLVSVQGSRKVPLSKFYMGVRKTVLKSNEVLTDITFPALKPGQRGTFLKIGLRRAQSISLVNTAVVLQMEGSTIKSAAITLGAVAPTIIHARESEEFLVGKTLTEENIGRTADLAATTSQPISDIRGSLNYRKAMVKTLVKRALEQLKSGMWKFTVPDSPIVLGKKIPLAPQVIKSSFPAPIHTNINGKDYIFSNCYNKTLLQLIREDAGLTGTKEGCGEGECGACTVHLNGKAVMACLIPAPCADGAVITTIEGINPSSVSEETNTSLTLHPVQQAFINHGAVQCGYCTPGFIMSACKLLEEQAHPSREQIRQALTGNLCRCTGYYKIIEAVEAAAIISITE